MVSDCVTIQCHSCTVLVLVFGLFSSLAGLLDSCFNELKATHTKLCAETLGQPVAPIRKKVKYKERD